VGAGGALDRLVVVDSASGTFLTVTRPSCADSCAPVDSASGTIAAQDVSRVFALIASERVFSMRDAGAGCPDCAEHAYYATWVQANGRRTLVRSDDETTPLLLGRVHVALAEAIRAARAPN
jgi:hypothetical protein